MVYYSATNLVGLNFVLLSVGRMWVKLCFVVVCCQNVKLLQQFISPYTGEVLETKKTGICQKQHRKLLIEVLKAQDCGEWRVS